MAFWQLQDPYYHGFAAQISFYLILSIVPIFLLLVQILGVLGVSADTAIGLIEEYTGNNIPGFIRDTISDNNLAPGIITRQKGLLWGQGPQLYQLAFEDGQIIQKWTTDADVQAWLDSWGYKQYLVGIMEDYLHTGG